VSDTCFHFPFAIGILDPTRHGHDTVGPPLCNVRFISRTVLFLRGTISNPYGRARFGFALKVGVLSTAGDAELSDWDVLSIRFDSFGPSLGRASVQKTLASQWLMVIAHAALPVARKLPGSGACPENKEPT
jgi:hypothetical protein